MNQMSIFSGPLDILALKRKSTLTQVWNSGLANTIGRATIFGVLANMTQLGTRLVTVPFVIEHLGLEGYGIWSIVMTIAGYMRFGSAGVKSAFQKYVAEATGSGDYKRVNELLSTGTAATLMVSLIGLIPVAFYSDRLTQAMGVPDHLLLSTAKAITLLAIMMVVANVGAVYEAVVMGGHRIDIVRKLGSAFTVFEAIAIVVSLHVGFGIVAMTVIMAFSEVAYLLCCFFASHRILPEIRISIGNISRRVLRDLVSYAGSYQLVGLLEMTYAAIIPLALLKIFGAVVAGEYALAHRLVWASLILAEATLPPLLSTGSMLYAGGSLEAMRLLLVKSFKATFALSLLPLSFIAAYGTLIIWVWTGLEDPAFSQLLLLMCPAGLFRGISLLQLVLYRASGRSLMDNIRQVLRIVIILGVCWLGPSIGLLGVMGGLAIAELAGLIFMFYALSRVYQGFSARLLISDTVKLTAAMFMIMTMSLVSVNVLLSGIEGGRTLSSLKLGIAVLAVVVVAWPALRLTGALSIYELRAMIGQSAPLAAKT